MKFTVELFTIRNSPRAKILVNFLSHNKKKNLQKQTEDRVREIVNEFV